MMKKYSTYVYLLQKSKRKKEKNMKGRKNNSAYYGTQTDQI